MATTRFLALGLAPWPALALLLLPACSGAAPPSRAAPASVVSGVGSLELISAIDLSTTDPRSRELSAVSWDPSARTLWAISDHEPQIVPLVPASDFLSWTMGEPVQVRVPGPWDGEGMAFAGNRLFIANESGPHVYEIDRKGGMLGEVELPAHFAESVPNKSLESLSATPDGRHLFVANESALLCDGAQPDAEAGTVVRVLRYELATGRRVEHAYRTDPIFAAGGGDMGVADLVALSTEDLLVLERSYVPGVGNSIRLYRADFRGDDVIDRPHLGAETRVMPKRLLTSFGDLPASTVVPRSSGAPRFPNYEGLSLGPSLPGGGRILFVISDDNARAEQVSRILVLRFRDGN